MKDLGRTPAVAAPNSENPALGLNQYGGEPMRNGSSFWLHKGRESMGKFLNLRLAAGGKTPNARIGHLAFGISLQHRRSVEWIEGNAEQPGFVK